MDEKLTYTGCANLILRLIEEISPILDSASDEDKARQCLERIIIPLKTNVPRLFQLHPILADTERRLCVPEIRIGWFRFTFYSCFPPAVPTDYYRDLLKEFKTTGFEALNDSAAFMQIPKTACKTQENAEIKNDNYTLELAEQLEKFFETDCRFPLRPDFTYECCFPKSKI